MKFPIGAMTVGDILDRGLKVLLARLPTFYLISLIALAPLILVQLALPMIQNAQFGQPGGGAVGVVVGGFVIWFILLVALSQIGSAAILHVIAQEFVDERVGVGQAFQFALQRFWKLLGASLLAGLVVGLGMILCLVPGIIFLVWYVFVGQVVVVEGLGGEKALSRSKELTSGFRWRVFGILVLTIVISAILGGAVGTLEHVLPYREMVPGRLGEYTITNYRNYTINYVISQLVNILVQTYQTVCMTLMYFDLRIRKEGFDLALAAQEQTPRPT